MCENFKVLKHPTDLKLNDVVATASSPKFKFYKMKTLSRNEMKNVMGGNAALPGCENGQSEWVCGSETNGSSTWFDWCSCATGNLIQCHVLVV